MNIEVFVLCDAATESHGKLNILGAFDTIFARVTPTVHPQCAVALRLRMSRIEEGDHKLTIHFINEDGAHVINPLNGNFRFTSGSKDVTATGSVNMVLNLQGLKLEQYGHYAINLAIDGREMASLPLYLKQAKPESEIPQ